MSDLFQKKAVISHRISKKRLAPAIIINYVKRPQTRSNDIKQRYYYGKQNYYVRRRSVAPCAA